MFGLFKKQATLEECGYGIFHLAFDPLSSDCCRSLGARFQDFDARGGISKFLESKSVPIEEQKLYFRLFTHCAVQAVCTQFNEGKRRSITRGAITNGFPTKIDEYDFETTYGTLEATFRGQHRFGPAVEPLNNPSAQISWLPNSNVGVLNAKYLIENFVLSHMKNKDAFIEDFGPYSSTISAAIGLMQRAMDHFLKSFKVP